MCDAELKKYITKYYKNLVGPSSASNVYLDESRLNDIPQVSAIENDLLIANFTEEEVREAIFQMVHNKAPGPDGFPPKFYQVFWHIIKEDLMALCKDFHDGTLLLHSLNFGTIILLPRSSDAR
jgi:hypothetical protein